MVIGGLGSLWGTFLGLADLWPGAVVRHPDLAALLAVLGVRADGRHPDRPPLGPVREAAAMMTPASSRRIPWTCSSSSSRRCDSLARLALRYLSRNADRDQRAVRHQPQSAARHDRPGLVRSCRLFRHRLLCLRHPDEDLWRCRSRSRCRPRRPGGAAWRAGVRLLLRAPDQDLLRHADARLLADRLGDLLQMERCHRRRSRPARTCPIQISTGCRRSRASATCASATSSTC